ncbi:MAG: hypothetical protein N2376_01720, partial [Clostridia bacterium]|nr:hypothetical protein [Clostridia bacterium]
MYFTELRKSFISPKGRFFQVFIIFVISLMLNILVDINASVVHVSGIFSYNNLWHHILVFLSVVISLSVFIVSFYTYPQIRNFRLLITGITFLTVGLLDWLHVLEFTGSAMDLGTPNQTLLLWLISRTFNVIGITVVVSSDFETRKPVKRRF